MHSLQRHNPPENSTMKTLGHVVKTPKSFRFLPCIYYENKGSTSKLEAELKIKCCILMAHRSHSKLD